MWKTGDLYLVKASNKVLSHCECDFAPIAAPQQADCPWCGCGWLFTCVHCDKAFTFARAVRLDARQAEMINRSHARKRGAADVRRVEEVLTEMHVKLDEDREYVYFDGNVISADEDEVEFEGIFSSHSLACVPQVEALKDESILYDLLRNPAYWHEYAHEKDREQD